MSIKFLGAWLLDVIMCAIKLLTIPDYFLAYLYDTTTFVLFLAKKN